MRFASNWARSNRLPGNVLVRKGQLDDAIAHFHQAIELRSDYPEAHYNLGLVLLQRKDVDGAIAQFRTVLSFYPHDAQTHISLANAFIQKHLFGEAADNFKIALKSEPDSTIALNNLAWLLSAGPEDSLRNGPEAVELALKLNRISNQTNIAFNRTLAAAYAEAGEFAKAAGTAQAASNLARAQGQESAATTLEREADLYRHRLPLRDRTLLNGP